MLAGNNLASMRPPNQISQTDVLLQDHLMGDVEELPSYEESDDSHPPPYALIRVPIRESDLERLSPRALHSSHETELTGEQMQPQRQVNPASKPGWKRLYARNRSEPEFYIVEMNRAEYDRYWRKGNDGEYLPGLEEPPGGRREWVKRQLELNQIWKREARAREVEADENLEMVDGVVVKSKGANRRKVGRGVGNAAAVVAVVATGPVAVGAMWGWDRMKKKRELKESTRNSVMNQLTNSDNA